MAGENTVVKHVPVFLHKLINVKYKAVFGEEGSVMQ